MSIAAEGTYKARIVRWGLSKASTGSDQFWLEIEVFARREGEELEPVQPSSETIYRTIAKDEQAGWLLSDLREIGYTQVSFTPLSPNTPEAFDFSNVEIWVRCRQENYQGREKSKWEWIREPRSPLAANQLAALDEKFKSALEAHKSKLAERMPTIDGQK